MFPQLLFIFITISTVDPAENEQPKIATSDIFTIKKKEADFWDLHVKWNTRQARVVVNYERQIAGFESGHNVVGDYRTRFHATGALCFTDNTDIVVFDTVTEENGGLSWSKEVYVTNLVKLTSDNKRKDRSFIILQLDEKSFPFLNGLDEALALYKQMKQLPISNRWGNVDTNNDPAFDLSSYYFDPSFVYAQIEDVTATEHDPTNKRIYFKNGKHVLCKAQSTVNNNDSWLPEDYIDLLAAYGVKRKTYKISDYIRWSRVQVSCKALWQKPNVVHNF